MWARSLFLVYLFRHPEVFARIVKGPVRVTELHCLSLVGICFSLLFQAHSLLLRLSKFLWEHLVVATTKLLWADKCGVYSWLLYHQRTLLHHLRALLETLPEGLIRTVLFENEISLLPLAPLPVAIIIVLATLDPTFDIVDTTGYQTTLTWLFFLFLVIVIVGVSQTCSPSVTAWHPLLAKVLELWFGDLFSQNVPADLKLIFTLG